MPRKPSPPKAAARAAPTEPPFSERFAGAIGRRAGIYAALLVLFASLRIAATYVVYSHTSDEPAHIACGMEWLDRGAYRYEAQHPPLARVAAALGPRLLGVHSHPKEGKNAMYLDGLAILHQDDKYDRTLAAARAGVLPFFWMACLVVYLWAKRDFGPAAAVLAVFAFTFLPPVLAHAGLATTDMAVTAFLGAAFLAGRRWLERPTPATGAIFGVCGALAALSKFSSLAFFPAATGLALACWFWKARPSRAAVRALLPTLGVAVATGFVLVWAAYRFSFHGVPAPEFFRGIGQVAQHNEEGHLSYLLGSVSRTGFPDFYFVALAVKTPLGFLGLAAAGLFAAIALWKKQRAARLPVAFCAGILLAGAASRINIGVRHILPVYLGLSILAALGILRLLDWSRTRKWAGAATALLLLWFGAGSLRAHPDYLPYFNELAKGHPEEILVDSDLDWGQDLKRLNLQMRAMGVPSLWLGALWWFEPQKDLPTVRPVDPSKPHVGWNAVAVTDWKLYRFGFEDREPAKKFWMDSIPPDLMVGKSVYVWYFPPGSQYLR